MIRKKTIIKKKSILYLKKILKGESSQRVFLLTGKKSFKKSGAFKFFSSNKNNNIVIHQEVSQNVINLNDALKIMKKLKKSQANLIIAVGGGGVIDMAKLINILLFNKKDNIKFLNQHNKITDDFLPLYVLPTTFEQ